MLSVLLGAGSLVHVLSVALLRPVSSILLSFAGDASHSVFSRFYYAIFSEVLQKTHTAALARGSFRDPTPLSVTENLPSFTGLVQARNGLGGAGNPWNVNRVHTNTQYLLRELSRGRFIRD